MLRAPLHLVERSAGRRGMVEFHLHGYGRKQRRQGGSGQCSKPLCVLRRLAMMVLKRAYAGQPFDRSFMRRLQRVCAQRLRRRLFISPLQPEQYRLAEETSLQQRILLDNLIQLGFGLLHAKRRNQHPERVADADVRRSLQLAGPAYVPLCGLEIEIQHGGHAA